MLVFSTLHFEAHKLIMSTVICSLHIKPGCRESNALNLPGN